MSKHISVLVVDDNEFTNKYLNLLFKNTFKEIIFARSGSEVLSLSNTKDFDMILMDINLPDTDGFQLADIIKEKHPEVTIIFQTAHNTEEIKTKIKDKGFHFLEKPLRKEQVLNIVNNLFAN